MNYICKPTRSHDRQQTRTAVVIILVTLLNQVALGQLAKLDSNFVQVARNQAVGLYERSVKQQAHVYEGNEYVYHDPRIKVHPYYPVDSLLIGTVVFNDVRYQDVRMLYDIVRDEVVVQPPNGGYQFYLRTDKIREFMLGRHQFARFVGDSVAGIRTGFYEIIHNGNVKALAQRLKIIHEDISGGSYKADYQQKDRFVIQKDGMYYDIKTKRSLLNLFPEQAKELRKYLRTNGLKFTEARREEAIVRTAQRYDELTR